MLSLRDHRTLNAAVVRIVPGEGSAHPLVAGVGSSILDCFARDPEIQDVVQTGLLLLQARGFVRRTVVEQDAILAELENHPSIALLVRLCIEGYYTSPPGLADVGFRVTA